MNQTRSFLLIAWLFVAGFLFIQYNSWNAAQHAPANAVPAPAASTSAGTSAAANGALPAPALPGASPATAAAASAAAASADDAPRYITLSNDELRVKVDLNGGRIASAQLLQYTVEKKPGSPNVVLLDSAPSTYYAADAGLVAVDPSGARHELRPRFSAGASEFSLGDKAVALVVPLQWTDAATGISITRTLSLKRGSYVVEIDDRIDNRGTRQVNPFLRLERVAPPPPPKHSFATNPDSFSFVGAGWYTPQDKFEKTPFSKYESTKPPTTDTSGGWTGMLQHHFITAWVPPTGEKQRIETSIGSHLGTPVYALTSYGPGVAPGTTQQRSAKLWVGPKLQAPLNKLHDTLPLIVDYGHLAFISRPLFWLLAALHQLLGNWGWSIIAIVLILKAALYWPSKKQYQSMAKMRAVQPRIEALKERYGDDKQALNVAMFELYKKEKVNPAAGCWPILVQMPIFLGLYWVLIETVELRQAPWMGWIQNLTGPDPYFILPALNLLIMFLTQRLTPTPGMDPMQKKMMQFMPLVFGVMMAFFPAGLVLYWVTNGALGLLQQWWMMRRYGMKPATATVAR
jgi:YidC/Oxa1 family membrane protein insertase